MLNHAYYQSPKQAQQVTREERDAKYMEFVLRTASNKYRSEGKRILPVTVSQKCT